jgi:hypothetical protein
MSARANPAPHTAGVAAQTKLSPMRPRPSTARTLRGKKTSGARGSGAGWPLDAPAYASSRRGRCKGELERFGLRRRHDKANRDERVSRSDGRTAAAPMGALHRRERRQLVIHARRRRAPKGLVEALKRGSRGNGARAAVIAKAGWHRERRARENGERYHEARKERCPKHAANHARYCASARGDSASPAIPASIVQIVRAIACPPPHPMCSVDQRRA